MNGGTKKLQTTLWHHQSEARPPRGPLPARLGGGPRPVPADGGGERARAGDMDCHGEPRAQGAGQVPISLQFIIIVSCYLGTLGLATGTAKVSGIS